MFMEKVKFDKVGFNLHQGVCPNNGLKVIVAPVFNAKEVKAGLYIDRGGMARDYFIGNTRIYPGTANLLVKSLLTKYSAKCEKLFGDEIDLKGYVEESFTTISYKTKTEKALDLIEPLLSLVDDLSISNDEVERIKMSYKEDIEQSELTAPNLIRKNLYIKSPMGKNPTGNLEDLKKVHLVALKRFFETFYQIKNMTLIVTGNISPDEVFEVANAHRFNRIKSERAIRLQKIDDADGSLNSALSFDGPNNTLILGLKFPKREVLFNMFGDNLFSYYALLQASLFSKVNTKTSSILKSIVNIGQGGIKQGGEDAFLYQTFEVGDMNQGMAEIKEFLSMNKIISRMDFRNLKSACFERNLEIYKNDVDEYFNILCEDYANRFASQAITTAIKKIKYAKYIKFLDYLLKSPISFVAEKN